MANRRRLAGTAMPRIRLATSVRHIRRDQEEPDPTESDTAPAGSYLSVRCAKSGSY